MQQIIVPADGLEFVTTEGVPLLRLQYEGGITDLTLFAGHDARIKASVSKEASILTVGIGEGYARATIQAAPRGAQMMMHTADLCASAGVVHRSDGTDVAVVHAGEIGSGQKVSITSGVHGPVISVVNKQNEHVAGMTTENENGLIATRAADGTLATVQGAAPGGEGSFKVMDGPERTAFVVPAKHLPGFNGPPRNGAGTNDAPQTPETGPLPDSVRE